MRQTLSHQAITAFFPKVSRFGQYASDYTQAMTTRLSTLYDQFWMNVSSNYYYDKGVLGTLKSETGEQFFLEAQQDGCYQAAEQWRRAFKTMFRELMK